MQSLKLQRAEAMSQECCENYQFQSLAKAGDIFTVQILHQGFNLYV